MYTIEELEAFAQTDIQSVDIESLTDIRDIRIDASKPVKHKMEAYLQQCSNPYIHRLGDYIVKVSFSKEGPTLDECLEEYIRGMVDIHVGA